jgi:hypothetical protein
MRWAPSAWRARRRRRVSSRISPVLVRSDEARPCTGPIGTKQRQTTRSSWLSTDISPKSVGKCRRTLPGSAALMFCLVSATGCPANQARSWRHRGNGIQYCPDPLPAFPARSPTAGAGGGLQGARRVRLRAAWYDVWRQAGLPRSIQLPDRGQHRDGVLPQSYAPCRPKWRQGHRKPVTPRTWHRPPCGAGSRPLPPPVPPGRRDGRGRRPTPGSRTFRPQPAVP